VFYPDASTLDIPTGYEGSIVDGVCTMNQPAVEVPEKCGGGSGDSKWVGIMKNGECILDPDAENTVFTATRCNGNVDIPGTNISYGFTGRMDGGICARDYPIPYNPLLHASEADPYDDWHYQADGSAGSGFNTFIDGASALQQLPDLESRSAAGPTITTPAPAVTPAVQTPAPSTTNKPLVAAVGLGVLGLVDGIGNLGSDTNKPIRVCDSRFLIPKEYSVRDDPVKGVVIRDGVGRVQTMGEYCNNPVCVYVNADYTGTFAILGETGLKEVLNEAGITLPSIDGNVCEHDKVRIIEFILGVLDKMGDVNDVLDDVMPAWLAKLIGDFPLVDKFENIANITAAAIEFGRGNFDKAVINVIEAIPGAGSFQQLIFKEAGLGSKFEKLDDSIPLDVKQLIIETSATVTGIVTAAFPPSTPAMAILDAFIMFGNMRWDEALESILTMGLGKFLTKLFGPILEKIKEVQDATIKLIF
jgi:hypothetical protein